MQIVLEDINIKELDENIQALEDEIERLENEIEKRKILAKQLEIRRKISIIKKVFNNNLEYKHVAIENQKVFFNNKPVFESSGDEVILFIPGDWIGELEEFYKIAVFILKNKELKELEDRIKNLRNVWKIE